MSKLTHFKRIARNRRKKHKSVKRYSKKEMLALMPFFKGAKVINFKGIITTEVATKDGAKEIFMQIDKNGQICDCTRIGNIFTYLNGRNPMIVNWEYRFIEEFNKL